MPGGVPRTCGDDHIVEKEPGPVPGFFVVANA